MPYEKEVAEKTALLAASNIRKNVAREPFTSMHLVLDVENQLNFSVDCLF